MKPDGQNSVIPFVVSKWLFLESLVFYRWSRGTKTLGTRLTMSPCIMPSRISKGKMAAFLCNLPVK